MPKNLKGWCKHKALLNVLRKPGESTSHTARTCGSHSVPEHKANSVEQDLLNLRSGLNKRTSFSTAVFRSHQLLAL